MGAPKYRWQDMMDGQWHDLFRGRDFDVSQASFTSAAYGWAERHHYRITVSKIGSNGVSIQKTGGSGMVLDAVLDACDSLAEAREHLRTADLTPGEHGDVELMLTGVLLEAGNLQDELKEK